ncbi:MAG: purine-nucleoside phosphorylase [Synergistaceae bacterium]|nr:purine-nucleoside phosphorylase [Synergistaceae bacterium]
MPNYDYSDALETVSFLRERLPFTPVTAIVLGSGLGEAASIIDERMTLNSSDIPNWPCSTAPGHAGRLILGTVHSRPVMILQGRVHHYEGYSMKAVTFPVRVLGMLGTREYIATNASGAVNMSYRAGEILAVKDHINLMGDNPLTGQNEPRWNERFPDMSRAYDPEMLSILSEIGLKQSVYAAMPGPSFETPAEIRMLRILGADLVGMSTVPEIITANSMGMKCAVLSCAANMAAGVDPNHTLTAQEVLDAMRDAAYKLSWVIEQLIDIMNRSTKGA